MEESEAVEMAMWNPWRGCHRHSPGCRYCYIHKGDQKRGVDTEQIVKTDKFDAPIAKNKNGSWKIKSSQIVYLCFSSDFLLEEADAWRIECWKMIRQRPDLRFLFLTKRIERFMDCIPPDWGNGYENVIVGCTVENQEMADFRLPIFSSLPIRHKVIVCQPMVGPIDLGGCLERIEQVVVGGESDRQARVLDYAWVLAVRKQCIEHNVSFEFRQLGTHFRKDGRMYTIKTRDLCAQAKKAGINWPV